MSNDKIQMTILAIDTSSVYLSLAVMKNGRIASRLHRKAVMAHSRILVPAIDKVLKKAGLKIGDIDCFAISIGPGSFTGLRIGVTTVKGFAYALKKPVVAVPTLDVIAQNARKFKGMICPVLDARKNKVYACLYQSDGKMIKRISKYLLITAKDLIDKRAGYDKILFLGDALHLIGKPDAGKAGWYPRADVVAKLSLGCIKKKKFVKPEDLEPLYLYSKECDITGK